MGGFIPSSTPSAAPTSPPQKTAARRPPKRPGSSNQPSAPMPAPAAGKTNAKAMPFTAYMEKRASGAPGTGSNSAKTLRDRAARLRAKAHARAAAHQMS